MLFKQLICWKTSVKQTIQIVDGQSSLHFFLTLFRSGSGSVFGQRIRLPIWGRIRMHSQLIHILSVKKRIKYHWPSEKTHFFFQQTVCLLSYSWTSKNSIFCETCFSCDAQNKWPFFLYDRKKSLKIHFYQIAQCSRFSRTKFYFIHKW